VAEEAGLVLLPAQVLSVGVGLTVLSGPLSKLGQIRLASQGQQGFFGAGRFRLSLDDLGGLGYRDITRQEGRFGVGALPQPAGGLQRLAGLGASGARLLGQPGVAVAEALLPVGA
jgi:hypothetical protein